MNNEDNTNYGLDVNLICDFFMGMDRQGPGSPDMTLKALSFIEGLDEHSRIADLGCGTGGQTMTLAEAYPGQITAIDNYPGYIEKLNQAARARELHERVKGLVGTMEELPFEPESLDAIWCEGAIFPVRFVGVVKRLETLCAMSLLHQNNPSSPGAWPQERRDMRGGVKSI